MKIVVVGSGGQLGAELCRRFGGEALGLDLPEFDLTDRRGLLEQLEAIRPDVIVNTAAHTRVDQAEDEPEAAQAINAEGVAHLVDACRRLDSFLVQVSTDYVFGGDAERTTPYRETDPSAPVNIYGKTKLAGEGYAAAWERYLIVRTSGLYGVLGPRSSGNFVDAILHQANRKDRLEVVADQRSTPSFVPDVARAICFLVETRATGVYHVTNAGDTTWHGFAAEIVRLAGLAVEVAPISTVQYAARAKRPHYSVLDTARYHALPGSPPMPGWQESLARFLRRLEGP